MATQPPASFSGSRASGSRRSALLLAAGLSLQLLHGGSTLVSAQADSWDPSGGLPSPETTVEASTEIISLCAPRHLDKAGGRPVPTNAWWGNLITCDAESNATAPVWPNPFSVSVESSGAYGFALSYPYRNRFFGELNAEGVAKFYAHPKRNEVQLSAAEFAIATPSMHVVDWTDLGVTVQLQPSDETSKLETNLVSGMAYFTTNFQNLTPKIILEAPLQSINGKSVALGTVVSGSKFDILSVNGQRWTLYVLPSPGLTAQEVTLGIEVSTSMILTATATFNGVLRLTAVLDREQGEASDTYSSCIVTGGDVDIAGDSGYSFQWKTEGDCSQGLLHYALDHHSKTLTAASVKEVSGVVLHAATRGAMRAFTTITSPPVWNFVELRNVPVTHYPRSRLTEAAAKEQDLFTKLRNDIQSRWTVATGGSFYFTGKLVQQYASLCLMANDPVIVGSDVSLLRRCVTKLETAIAPFLDNSWTYKLKYDAIMGGIVSSESFVTGDLNADFGNTVYNDHHYHYSYWVHMASVINYLHPSWERIEELNAMTRLLLRDVATPTHDDPFFPKFRYFDWFRGHSYSHGMTTFADGKDEESTSEDINFAYGMALFGQATGHARMEAIGRLMTKISVRSMQTYFLFDSSNTIHPAEFRPNMVPGILFDNKADYATWFCGEKSCIHGIQMLPITPVTEYVRSSQFVHEEWANVLSTAPIVTEHAITNPWLSLLYANYARIDKVEAMRVLNECTMMDGLSRSWALYMAAQFSL